MSWLVFMLIIIFIFLIIIIDKIKALNYSFYSQIKSLEESIEDLKKEIISLKDTSKEKIIPKKESIVVEEIKEVKEVKLEEVKKETILKESKKEKSSQKEEVLISEEELFPIQKWSISEFFNSINFEEFLIKNILLKIGVLIFIIGIGFFLKYSIDNDIIPIWARMIIGIIVGNVMIFTALKMLKQPKYFSESFFGAGIAILYLSIFAGYALDSFKVLDYKVAFFAMVMVTFFAGFISVKFDSLTTAVFGLIGGFATPFLISSSSHNINSLLGYIVILNLGILYISIYKRWAILSWLSFVLTSILANISIPIAYKFQTSSVLILSIYLSLFFILYAVIPFINHLKEQKELPNSLLYLFIVNFFAVIIGFVHLFYQYEINIKLFAFVTLSLASFLILAVIILTKKGYLQKSLITTSLSQSLLLILATPFIVFDNLTLTLILALESLILLYIGVKNRQQLFILFSYIGYILTAFNIYIDLIHNLNANIVVLTTKDFIEINLKHSINTIIAIASFFFAFILIKKSDISLFEFKKLTLDVKIAKIILFIFAFYTSFIIFFQIGYVIFDYLNIFDNYFISYVFVLFLISILLYDKSEYRDFALYVFKLFYFIVVLALFINFSSTLFVKIAHREIISPLLNFSIFAIVSFFVYSLFFQTKEKILNFKTDFLFASFSYFALFIFLNIQIYNTIYYFFDKTAAKISITFLWVIYSITTLIISLVKDIKEGRVVGFVMLSLAILKTFFIDLANSKPIYKIILFIVVGLILFITSYYYNKIYKSKQKDNS